MSDGSNYLGRLRSLILCQPYSLERFRSKAMQMRVEQHLKRGAFDLIICDSLYALANVPDTAVPLVLNCHNVEHMILRRYAGIESRRARKWYAGLEALLLRRAELRGCCRVTCAMTCSENDRVALGQLHPALPIYVVPNSVDTKCFQPFGTYENSDDPPVLLFQGGMDWYPNRDAVEFFIHRILPLIRVGCPDVKFVVAGRNPPPEFVERFHADSGIEFTGTVRDMVPYLSTATVIVVPLRLGSGTRIKILEACAAGKAVVSTSVGAEGLDFGRGSEILIADDPETFARSVLDLFKNREVRDSIGRAARKVVVERYSDTALRESLRRALSAFTRSDAGATASRVESCLQPS